MRSDWYVFAFSILKALLHSLSQWFLRNTRVVSGGKAYWKDPNLMSVIEALFIFRKRKHLSNVLDSFCVNFNIWEVDHQP